MSTTVSQTQVKTSVPKCTPNLNAPPRLVRSSSIQKIIKLNTYICSQHYSMLPAIVNWVKSSQNSTEKTIITFRSILFSSFLYKFFFDGCKTIIGDILSNLDTRNFQQIIRDVASVVSVYFVLPHNALSIGVYLAAFAIFGQLLFCVYLLVLSVIPVGLTFMLVSFCYINVLFYRTTKISKKIKKN